MKIGVNCQFYLTASPLPEHFARSRDSAERPTKYKNGVDKAARSKRCPSSDFAGTLERFQQQMLKLRHH